jgi:acyl carrier protein
MAHDTDIRHRVLRVLRSSLSLNLSEEEAGGADSLDAFFGMDSMATLEFLVALEKEFGVRLEPDEIESGLLRSLSRLTRYLAEKTQESGA